MQLGILGRPDGWHVRRIATEAAARGHQAVTVRWESLRAAVGPHGENLGPASIVPLDMLVVRGMPAAGLRQLPGGGLEEVIFRMNVLARMEQAGLSVVNPPRALEIAIDKYLSLAMIAERGLAVPETFVAQDDGAIREAWDRLGRDAVVKPIFGSRGRGLVRIHEAEALEQLLVARTAGSPLYLQEFIPHVGWDLRVFLAGALRLPRRSDRSCESGRGSRRHAPGRGRSAAGGRWAAGGAGVQRRAGLASARGDRCGPRHRHGRRFPRGAAAHARRCESTAANGTDTWEMRNRAAA